MIVSEKKNKEHIKLLYIGEGNRFLDDFVEKHPQFKLRSVTDGRHAFEFLKQKHVDLLVCSNNIMDGQVIEFREYLKKNYLLLGIPFLVFCKGKEEEKILKFNCSKYYALCCTPNNLESTINSILPRLEKNKNISLELKDAVNYKVKISAIKKVVEFTISLFLLFLLSPIYLIIALLIKIESKGPIIFISTRMGKNMEITRLYKFRTMFVKSTLDEQAEIKNNFRDPIFVKPKNDSRVTKIGKVLRRYSLDELPQLINVIKGDICLIGNRPLPLAEAEKVIATGHIERFYAPAGISGLWQVSGKKIGVSAEVRLWQDVFYSKYYSVKLDIQIFFKTFLALKQRDSSM